MEIPGIGSVTKEDGDDWYYSTQLSIAVLGGSLCRIIVDGYDDDERKEDFHTAINNFLSANESVLREVEPHIFKYYESCKAYFDPEDKDNVEIKCAKDVWQHVRLGNQPMFMRRAYGDKGIYVSLECGCGWEPEHGLQIVFKNGLKVNKVGAYDGHLTNSDAYDDETLENVIYK